MKRPMRMQGEEFNIQANGVEIHGVRMGQGEPLLLLHGHPETCLMWHKVAPQLAERFTVVATDLRTAESRRGCLTTATTPSGLWRRTKSR